MAFDLAYAMKRKRKKMAKGGETSEEYPTPSEVETEVGVLVPAGEEGGSSEYWEQTPESPRESARKHFGMSKKDMSEIDLNQTPGIYREPAFDDGGKVDRDSVANYTDFLESHPEMQKAEPPPDVRDKIDEDLYYPHFEDPGPEHGWGMDRMAAGGGMIDRIMKKRKMAFGGLTVDPNTYEISPSSDWMGSLADGIAEGAEADLSGPAAMMLASKSAGDKDQEDMDVAENTAYQKTKKMLQSQHSHAEGGEVSRDDKALDMIGHIMKKRMKAKGGSIESDFDDSGESGVGPKGEDLFESNSDQIQDHMGYQHRTYLDDAYDSMESDPMRKMADGGDIISRAMKKCKYSKGGMVANETPITAGFKPNEFDDLALRDDIESSYTGENSGDDLGSMEEDDRRRDIVSRVMRSRMKKDRLPRPA